MKSRNLSRVSALMMSAALILPGSGSLFAQDSTPPADPELVTETSGQLPAADLPTMNAQGHSFEFSSTFNGSLTEVPVEAPVYAMNTPSYTAEQVADIAAGLGLDGDVQDLGDNTYSVTGETGSLFVFEGRLQYISSEPTPEGDLSDDSTAVATARDWLRVNGMLPPNVGDGWVMARTDEPPRVHVVFQPITPSSLISSTPNVTVALGPEGTVVEATNSWAEISVWQTFQLRGAETAWGDVEGRQAWVDAQLPTEQFPPGTTIGGSVEYTRISLTYTTSGVPGEQQYLQPVYMFEGTLTPDGVDQTFSVRAYVPALINANQPVG